MDMLHLVPFLLLGIFLAWFFWPVVVDPVLDRWRTARRNGVENADRIADTLFSRWSEHGSRPGLVDPPKA